MKGKRIGHTFTEHGPHMSQELQLRATGGNQSVGQWIDQQAAEDFIASKLDELKKGAKDFDIPEGLGRVFLSDGSVVKATRARLVPSGSGVKTAFPIVE